jgi:hypothetical protein
VRRGGFETRPYMHPARRNTARPCSPDCALLRNPGRRSRMELFRCVRDISSRCRGLSWMVSARARRASTLVLWRNKRDFLEIATQIARDDTKLRG